MKEMFIFISLIVVFAITIGSVLKLYEIPKYKDVCFSGLLIIPFYIILYVIYMKNIYKGKHDFMNKFKKKSFINEIKFFYGVNKTYLINFKISILYLGNIALSLKKIKICQKNPISKISLNTIINKVKKDTRENLIF